MSPPSRPPSSIDRELLAILERAFAEHAGPDAVIDLDDLKKALHLQNPYFARRVLEVLDQNGDGVVRKDEFLEGIRALVAGTDREKLRFAFRIHDHDDDGSLDRDELLRMITISLAESDTKERVTQPAEALVRELLRRADRDGDGKLSFEELEAHVATRPDLLTRMVRSEAIWISPNEDLLRWLDRGKGSKEDGPRIAPDRGPAIFIALFVLANLAMFGVVLGRGLVRGANPLMQVGRALGTMLSLDAALVLLPMMRRLLTKVRPTALGRLLPLDSAITFHQIVGHVLFVVALVHAAAFLVVYPSGHPRGLDRLLFGTTIGLTGTLLLAVFTLMWVCSLPFVRRGRRFELFYFTHLLYVVWIGLVIVHAPRVLLFAGLPLLAFLVEQALRLARRGRRADIVATAALRSGVTRLELTRPRAMTFQPGDYAFLRIPAIAQREWHPFTISSAPEQPNLGFHVRSLGNWSAALRRVVEERNEPKDLVAYVDGPYGTPTARIFAARNVVLIGAGIGVTPFASVLESLVLRGNGKSDRPSQLAHAHFFWLNRDQYSFEWFAALLRDLEESDAKQMLEIHLCMTAGRAGATSLGLELARDAMRSAGRSDMFTGLRTHTHLGPPDWDTLLGAVQKRHAPEPVEVFFCGPHGLGQKLRPICERLGFAFHEEKF
ncbi:MAG: EF-hand domain-containing protein [Myxococcales bacterium]|nr:EF-hand domain-containing protein [Myxococcales bacterium]